MIHDLDKSAHSVHILQYHFVQCVKYRRKALTNPLVVDLLKKTIKDISQRFDVGVLNIEADKDHFHLLFKTKPTIEMSKYINAIKTISSREIRRNFPEVHKLLWKDAFWSRSYFLATTGQVTLDVLKRYVDNQGKNKND
jgi:putative transposase